MQQDALLSHCENGTITLIGATTENPYYSLNNALLSRVMIFEFKALERKDIEKIVRRGIEKLELKDVSDETVAAIMENQYDISGVDIKQDTIRVYEGGEACSSILGYTGTISSEELKKDDSKLTINSSSG